MIAKREVFKDQAYFDHYVEYRSQQRIPNYRAKADASDSDSRDRRRLYYAIFRETLHLLIARYSRGEDISALRESFPQVVDALADYQAEQGYEPFDFQNLDDYVRALWLISLAQLLDIEDGCIDRLLRLIDQDGQDTLFERLVALKMPGRSFDLMLIHPKPYALLYESLDAQGEKRDSLINKFLKQYYPSMESTYWHDTHLKDQAGFFGYWCFELAAFVKGLQIDDTAFADNQYYPCDLARR
jgi:hypothetical protein